MKTHRIGYGPQMIRAKKNNWKTVTRRPIKPQPERLEVGKSAWEEKIYAYDHKDCKGDACEYACNGDWLKCPYGTPGDLLLATEPFRITDCSDFERAVKIRYTADDYVNWTQLTQPEWEKYRAWKEPFGKKSGIFLFKSLSRFVDVITHIEVERIQDITANEIMNEGLRVEGMNGWADPELHEDIYREDFKKLWQEMYQGSPFDWDNNPWVWVIRTNPANTEQRLQLQEELQAA